MPDVADIASETVDYCTAEAHRRQAKASAPEAQPGYAEWDKLHCVDCGEDIPLKRAMAQRCRCVECQSLLEKRR